LNSSKSRAFGFGFEVFSWFSGVCFSPDPNTPRAHLVHASSRLLLEEIEEVGYLIFGGS